MGSIHGSAGKVKLKFRCSRSTSQIDPNPGRLILWARWDSADGQNSAARSLRHGSSSCPFARQNGSYWTIQSTWSDRLPQQTMKRAPDGGESPLSGPKSSTGLEFPQLETPDPKPSRSSKTSSKKFGENGTPCPAPEGMYPSTFNLPTVNALQHTNIWQKSSPAKYSDLSGHGFPTNRTYGILPARTRWTLTIQKFKICMVSMFRKSTAAISLRF